MKHTTLLFVLVFFGTYLIGQSGAKKHELLHAHNIACNSISIKLADEYVKSGGEVLIIETQVSNLIWERASTMYFQGHEINVDKLEEGTYRFKVLPNTKMKNKYGEDYYKMGYITKELTIDCANKVVNSSLRLYPNPSTESIYIDKVLKGSEHLIIYNSAGQISYSTDNLSRNKIDISDLADGLYHVILRDGEESLTTKLLKL